jgi:hypothetical protein
MLRCLLLNQPKHSAAHPAHSPFLTLRKWQSSAAASASTDSQPVEASATRADYLSQLKDTSTLIHQRLGSLKWLVRDSAFYAAPANAIQVFHASRQVNASKLDLVRFSSNLTDYILSNFDKLSTKEKALTFRLFSIINPTAQTMSQKSEKLIYLLCKLERDYLASMVGIKQSEELAERFELVDLINYFVGFNFHRTGQNANLQMHAQTTNVIFEMLVSSLRREEKVDKLGSRKEEVSSDEHRQAIDRILSEDWLLNEANVLTNALAMANQMPLLDRNGMSLLFHLIVNGNYEKLAQVENKANQPVMDPAQKQHLLTLGN